MSTTAEELTRTTPVKDGEVLPMQTREFVIAEFKKLPKKAKRTKEEKIAANIERRKKKAAGDTGADDDPEETEEDDATDAGADEDRFAIAISSEFPVRRWFGQEILDHSPEAVDLSRAKSGLSFLDSHDSKSIIGVVNDVKLDKKEKVLRGVVQFSRNPKAQEVKRDVQDGIRKYISVGYGVNEYTIVENKDDKVDTYRATSWTPYEASSVAVPADPNVGHNRKAGERGFPVKVINSSGERSAEQTTEARTMAETDHAQVLIDSRKTAGDIVKLGKRHGIDQERIATWISEGRTLDAVSALVLEEVASRSAKPITTPGAEAREQLELTEKEQREYNLARGIMMLVANEEADENHGKRQNCLELEISQTIERASRPGHGGLFVPWSVKNVNAISKRAGLDSATSTKGTELKFTEPGAFIEFLYNSMRVKELGATTISGLRDNVAYPKQTGKATGSWVAENPGSDVADSNLTLGQVPSSPHTYQSSTSYSRQLLAQAVIDVDTLVRQDLARDMALSADFAAIAGPTGGSSPVGIMNTTGVQSFVDAADSGNGGEVAYIDILKMIEDLEDTNADQLGDPAWLTTPSIKTLLKNTSRLANTIALPVWTDADTVGGYKARSSNQVPKTGVRGSTSNNHALILGVFSTLVIGMWGSGFELVVDPYRLKKQGMIELTTFMLMDVALKYPQAFVVAQSQK
jgi:HK97 family phage major capsid protein/HK97 family phage prohead protease